MSIAPKRKAAGFSLLEVVIGLTIFGLIVGALFTLVQGSVRAASQIERTQSQMGAVQRMIAILRQTFSSLPSAASLTLTLVDPNASATQELVITGSPSALGFGLRPISYSESTLALRPNARGKTSEQGTMLWDLALSRSDLIPVTGENRMALGQSLGGALTPDAQGRIWMPLLPELIDLRWRFYRQSDDLWLEEWASGPWPDLIEVQIQAPELPTTVRAVFAPPKLTITQGRNAPAANTAPATAAPPATTPAPR